MSLPPHPYPQLFFLNPFLTLKRPSKCFEAPDCIYFLFLPNSNSSVNLKFKSGCRFYVNYLINYCELKQNLRKISFINFFKLYIWTLLHTYLL